MAETTLAEHRAFVSRVKAEAKAVGSKTYFTGMPCKYGHIAERWISTGGCFKCLEATRASDKSKAWWIAYYQTDEYKAKQRAARSSPKGRARDRTRNAKEPRRLSARSRRFQKKYGLTHAQVELMRMGQNNQCLICSVVFCDGSHKAASMHIDHCHSTGIVRGLLCTHCNHGLGKFQDSADVLRRAIAYLEKHSAIAPISAAA